MICQVNNYYMVIRRITNLKHTLTPTSIKWETTVPMQCSCHWWSILCTNGEEQEEKEDFLRIKWAEFLWWWRCVMWLQDDCLLLLLCMYDWLLWMIIPVSSLFTVLSPLLSFFRKKKRSCSQQKIVMMVFRHSACIQYLSSSSMVTETAKATTKQQCRSSRGGGGGVWLKARNNVEEEFEFYVEVATQNYTRWWYDILVVYVQYYVVSQTLYKYEEGI